jgi:hypothetical protein
VSGGAFKMLCKCVSSVRGAYCEMQLLKNEWVGKKRETTKKTEV